MIGGGRRRMRDTIKPCPVVWSWLWSGGAGGTGGGGGGGAFVQRHPRLRRGASWGETPHPPPSAALGPLRGAAPQGDRKTRTFRTRPPVLPSGADGARGVRRDRDPRTETRTRHCRTGVEPGGVRADPGHVTYGSAETARASPRF